LNDDIRELLPRHRSDFERADAIVSKGYPAVAPVLPELFNWLQDCNWPISRTIAPFLAGLGQPIVPVVRAILEADDDIWKYWVLTQVVANAAAHVGESLRDVLTRIDTHPSQGEIIEGARDAAHDILSALGQQPSTDE